MPMALRLYLVLAFASSLAGFASERDTARNAWVPQGMDPGLFHYGMMEQALVEGNVKRASAHAQERTQHLTLISRPASLKRSYPELIGKIRSLRVQIRDVKASPKEPSPVSIKLPIQEDISQAIEEAIKESQEWIETIEEVD